MFAFMNKTLSSVNEDLKAGKTVVVTVAGQDTAHAPAVSADTSPDVHAVTTATFESSMHRIPYPLPAKPGKTE
jgi:hypothetical protein